MGSPQSLSEADRRIVAVWAADCAEHVLGLFRAAAPDDDRPEVLITRTRAFARGELRTSEAIRRRFAGGVGARDVNDPAAMAAARAAGQAVAVCHMGAHALGAAAYAAQAAGLADPGRPIAAEEEIGWQLEHMSAAARQALRTLPPAGSDSAGPLGPGLLASGQVGAIIREIQVRLADTRLGHVHEHQRFDDAAATWDDDPGHEKRQVAVAQAIKDAVSLSRSMAALDVGGGTGRLSILLADQVGSIVVTDPSAGMVQVARERIEAAGLGDRVRAVQADLTTDRLDGAYDVVWSSMALHHVKDLDGLLRSLAGLLVDGGRLCIADLEEDPEGAFHADKVDFDGHHGFDRQRLAQQLARAGFTDVSFTDATSILKGDREFGVFLCTATKAQPGGKH